MNIVEEGLVSYLVIKITVERHIWSMLVSAMLLP